MASEGLGGLVSASFGSEREGEGGGLAISSRKNPPEEGFFVCANSEGKGGKGKAKKSFTKMKIQRISCGFSIHTSEILVAGGNRVNQEAPAILHCDSGSHAMQNNVRGESTDSPKE